jgi:hypothetical protein
MQGTLQKFVNSNLCVQKNLQPQVPIELQASAADRAPLQTRLHAVDAPITTASPTLLRWDVLVS